jgi:hypothetical protein
MSETRRRSDPVHETWGIEYFLRHHDDDRSRSVPAREYLNSCPPAARARLVAIATSVAEGPPPQFSGGGMFEAMRGNMRGIHEIRIRNQKRLYRLFVVLDRNGPGLDGPSMVLITGADKANETAFSAAELAVVRRLADEYASRTPRSIVR